MLIEINSVKAIPPISLSEAKTSEIENQEIENIRALISYFNYRAVQTSGACVLNLRKMTPCTCLSYLSLR